MNNRFHKAKNISLFLTLILVTGTFASLFPSSTFITNVQALPSYYYDDGMDDNNYQKSKDSSVNINKIKCINDNININGANTGNISIGNNGRVASTAGEEGYSGANSYDGYYNYGYNNNKQDKGSDCIINNNNNNTNIISSGGNQTIPPTATLTVNKEIFGCDNIRPAEMNCEALQNNDPNWIPCTDPPISNSEFCQAISANLFDIEVLNDQNNLIQQFEGSAQGTIIQNLEPGTYTVNEIKDSTDGQLEGEPEITQECRDAGFTDGGLLITPGTEGDILYTICFEYEDEQGNDCSTIALAAGEEKTCTVKNYLRIAD